jgi:rubrerythrin
MSRNQTNIAEYLNCQSILESQTGLLYGIIASKVEIPLIKTLLKEIELDTQKHSLILKGVSESLEHTKGTQKDCSKNNPTLHTINKLLKEVGKIDRFGPKDLKTLSQVLVTLESKMGEEYQSLVQMKTLERMSKIINEEYSIDLTKVKSIFLKVITDEERHIEILETIRQLTAEKKQDSNDPFVKYQNPDAWFKVAPIAFYEPSS